jgi:hypothetical protein
MGVAAILVTVLSLPACTSTKSPKGVKQKSEEKICDCPDEATKSQTETREFLKDALFPREWSDVERMEALKNIRDYRQGFFTGPGGSWGSCQFQISDELLTRIIADKEARAKKKEFDFRTDTPPQQFRSWFDNQAMGLFANKKGKYETCLVDWWNAGKHPGEYFRSWERITHPPRWSVVVKVCPVEKGMRWVFFRGTSD